jgi:peptidyl-tRNA hydrolase, PTH1 family
VAQAIVGLGNPGPEYRDTRHNVGARALDGLAKKVRARFQRSGVHLVAQGKWRGEVVHLVKPHCFMNVTGPSLARILRKLGLGPVEIVLLYDDIDMPLGKVRVRLKGSAGGHNGVRSIIASLGSDQIRRVKIGIGRPAAPPGDREEVVDHVLSPFLPDELPTVEAACMHAASQALKLVEDQNSRRFV